MAEDWRSTFTAVLLTFLVLKYIWIGPEGNYRFEVGHNHVAYHANWTQTYSDLSSPSEMMRAQQLSVDRLDISLSMSSLSQQEIIALFPHPFRSYKEIKLNLANNRLGSQGADYVLSLIQNGVERLEIIFDSIAADNNLGDVLVKRLSNLNSLRKLKLSLILACKGRDDVLEKYFADSRLSSKL